MTEVYITSVINRSPSQLVGLRRSLARRVCPSWPQRSVHSCYSDGAAPCNYECGCCPVHSALYQHKLGYDKIVLVGPSAISL